MAVPLNAAVLALYPHLAPKGPVYQAGYTEAGAAARGLPPTTVPVELRVPGESFVQSWVEHARTAANVLPAVVAPGIGVALVGVTSRARADAQEAAAVQRESAQEARSEWETGFRDFGTTLAAQQATFGRELQALRATSGGTSGTFFQMPSMTSTLPMFRFPSSGGVTRLTLALRRGRRILTLEDLEP